MLLASLQLANAQLFEFSFFGSAGSNNSNESTGVAVSGSIHVNTTGSNISVGLDTYTANSIKFTINNLSDGSSYTYGDIVAFGFWNEPAGGGTPYSYSGFSHDQAPKAWTDTNSVTDLWDGNSYYGASGDSPTGFGGNNIAGGTSAMFEFSGASPASLANLVDAWTNEGMATGNDKDSHNDIRFRFRSVGPDMEDSEKLYLELQPVPEPSTYGMIGALALIGLVVARRFSRK